MSSNAITVENLHYTYPKAEAETLKGLSFSVGAGEIVGFLGPSGAGKSTTQKIMTGIIKGYRGRVEVLGREISRSDSSFYEQVGVAFEFPNFYGRLSGLENLQFFRSLYGVETLQPMELLCQMGLEEAARRKVSDYSKGMKMRLNLCRALLNKPKLLFLDEPTSGLDPVNAKLVKDRIKQEQAQGHTVVITTHNMNVAEEICDRVAFIVDGELKWMDSPRNLKLMAGQRRVKVEYREEGALTSREYELDGIGGNLEFLKLIHEKQVETMHTLEATLEDLFLQVTGRELQ